MSDRILRVGQNSCDLGGINFETNAFGDFPRQDPQQEQVIVLDPKTMTPEELKEAQELKDKILRRICGS